MTVFAALISVPSKCPHHKATTLNCKWLIISAKLKLSGLSQPGDFITLHSLQGGPARSKSRSIIGQEGTGLAHNWVCSPPEQRTSLPGDAALQRPKENVNTEQLNSTQMAYSIKHESSLLMFCSFLNLGSQMLITIINFMNSLKHYYYMNWCIN